MSYGNLKSRGWHDITADTRNVFDLNFENIVESKVNEVNYDRFFNRENKASVMSALYVTDRMALRPTRTDSGAKALVFRTEDVPYGEHPDRLLERDMIGEMGLPKEAEGYVTGEGVSINNAYTIKEGVTAGAFCIYYRPHTEPTPDATGSAEDLAVVRRNRGNVNGPFTIRGAWFNTRFRFKDFESLEHVHDIRVTDVQKSTFILPYDNLSLVYAYQIDGDDAGVTMAIPERLLGVVPDVAGSRVSVGNSNGILTTYRTPHYPIVNETFKLYAGSTQLTRTIGSVQGQYDFNPWTGEIFFNTVPAAGSLITAAYEYTIGGTGFAVNYATGVIKIAGPVFQANDLLRVRMRSARYKRVLSVTAEETTVV